MAGGILERKLAAILSAHVELLAWRSPNSIPFRSHPELRALFEENGVDVGKPPYSPPPNRARP